MIQSAAHLARRVAGSPESLVRGLAVLAVLVVAAIVLASAPRPAQAASVAGPACSVAGVTVAFLSDARAPTQTAGRPVFDRTDLCAADIELPADLGLPRSPAGAPRARHAAAASYGYAPDVARASAPDGSPHRPPRAA